ncbi:hypothetical protein HYX17_03815 [Candidatus Woesearchaeota archaeon]|nr:hypothetical protein [Candidatus Woesearchaeota archaeon]
MGNYQFTYKIEIDNEVLPDGRVEIKYGKYCDGSVVATTSIDAKVFLPRIFIAMMKYSGMGFRGIFTDTINTEKRLTYNEIISLERMVLDRFKIPIKLSEIKSLKS